MHHRNRITSNIKTVAASLRVIARHILCSLATHLLIDTIMYIGTSSCSQIKLLANKISSRLVGSRPRRSALLVSRARPTALPRQYTQLIHPTSHNPSIHLALPTRARHDDDAFAQTNVVYMEQVSSKPRLKASWVCGSIITATAVVVSRARHETSHRRDRVRARHHIHPSRAVVRPCVRRQRCERRPTRAFQRGGGCGARAVRCVIM